jgi:transposase
MKPAAFSESNPVPRHWEKRVLTAYLRMMGMTQKQAGAAVGRSERTIRDWEADTATWTQARDEARHRWLGELTDAARQTLLTVIRAGDGDLAMKVLERIDTDLAPPTQRLRHTHDIGQGLSSLLQAIEGDDADAG